MQWSPGPWIGRSAIVLVVAGGVARGCFGVAGPDLKKPDDGFGGQLRLRGLMEGQDSQRVDGMHLDDIPRKVRWGLRT